MSVRLKLGSKMVVLTKNEQNQYVRDVALEAQANSPEVYTIEQYLPTCMKCMAWDEPHAFHS